ncbi:MAG: glycosyltransferase family 4 protein [Planctomycetes bacterium]|nr:glycosyltransferase family 4 protein [Planctomycetota bacterium]
MHIALIRTEFKKSRGGAEAYAVQLARYWLGQGHRITVVCTGHDPADSEGMEVVTVSRPKVLGPFKHNWFAKRAGIAADECGADAVLALARAYPGDVLRLGDGLHAMLLEARYGRQGARLRAKFNPRHLELLKLERTLLKDGHFKLFIANSEMIRDVCVAWFDVPPEQIEVIPNGVDWSRFNTEVRLGREVFREQVGIPKDAKLVLFSGMDFRRKGLTEAVRGFIEFARSAPQAYFACVGPGYTLGAEDELAKAGLSARAKFVGRTDDIARWYGAADVFLLPTLHDPSANAVTEALACGTPVITSAANGAKQHIRDGVNGWVLADRTDSSEIAGRIGQLIQSPPVPDAVVDASSLLSREVNADRMLDALRRASQA